MTHFPPLFLPGPGSAPFQPAINLDPELDPDRLQAPRRDAGMREPEKGSKLSVTCLIIQCLMQEVKTMIRCM